MPSFKNIAIVGASGNIGKIILDSLFASDKFNLTAISRKESNAVFPGSVTVRKTDFSHSDLVDAFKGQDAVVSVVGATGFSEQQKLVDAALSAGVKRFFPSEFSMSSEDEAVVKLLPLFGAKKALIDYLRSNESETFTWTGIATSGLLDWGIETGFLQYDVANRTATIWDNGDRRFTMVNEKRLGDSVIAALEHHEETRNRYIYVYSVETSQNEILAALEKATESKWTVTKTTTEQQISEAQKKLSTGDFEGAFTLVRSFVFGNTEGLRSDYTQEPNLANKALGFQAESVQETVDRVVRNQV